MHHGQDRGQRHARPAARRGDAAADDGGDEHGEAEVGEAGALDIGAVSLAMWSGLLPAALRRFHRQRPEVTIQLRSDASSNLVSAVLAGELDLALVHGAAASADLATVHLLDDPMLLALAADHPLARRRRLSPRDLDGQPWIALTTPSQPLAREALIAACARAGFMPDVRFETSDRATVLGLVSAGLGVALLPASARRLAGRRVRLRELPWLPLRAPLDVVLRASGATPAAVQLAALLGS